MSSEKRAALEAALFVQFVMMMKSPSTLAFLGLVFLGCHSTDASRPSTPSALVIAHRGASAYAPEHTIAAYDMALLQGADYLEVDVQRTADNVLVAIHDATLDRTARGAPANCTGSVASKTYAQLQTCDVGAWFNDANPSLAHPEYVGQRIPSLQTLFIRYGSAARFYLETKNPEQYPGIENQIVDLLGTYGIQPGDFFPPGVIIESFSSSSLKLIRTLDPSLPTVQLFDVVTPGVIISQLPQVSAYASAIGVSRADVDAALIGAAHSRCIAVHTYVVDDRGEMQSLLATGVDGIFSDRPDLLRDVANSESLAEVQCLLAQR